MTNTLETFWRRVDTSAGPDGCWPWTGTLIADGYGRFKLDGRFHLAHRLALGLSLGRELLWTDAIREEACHHCDNPPCVNPAHLYVGDRMTNRRDAVNRGRARSSLAEENARKTHCPSGHEYTQANTYWHDGRHCRICRRDADLNYKQRRREALR